MVEKVCSTVHTCKERLGEVKPRQPECVWGSLLDPFTEESQPEIKYKQLAYFNFHVYLH